MYWIIQLLNLKMEHITSQWSPIKKSTMRDFRFVTFDFQSEIWHVLLISYIIWFLYLMKFEKSAASNLEIFRVCWFSLRNWLLGTKSKHLSTDWLSDGFRILELFPQKHGERNRVFISMSIQKAKVWHQKLLNGVSCVSIDDRRFYLCNCKILFENCWK